MRTYIGHQEALCASEFEELAFGFDADVQLAEFLKELFLGSPGESVAARAVRLDAAHGILADLQTEAPALAADVAVMLGATSMVRRSGVRRSVRIEAAG